MFQWFLLLGALFAASMSGYFAIQGFVANFGATTENILFALGLETGKILSVSFTYRYWHSIGYFKRGFAFFWCSALVLVSCLGIFGFLSAKQSAAVTAKNSIVLELKRLDAETKTYQAKLDSLDAQVAALPQEYAKAREKLHASFAPERERWQQKLDETAKQAQAKRDLMAKETHSLSVTMTYLSQALSINEGQALLFFTILITVIFEPLAIGLWVFYHDSKVKDSVFDRVKLDAKTVDKDDKKDDDKVGEAFDGDGAFTTLTPVGINSK